MDNSKLFFRAEKRAFTAFRNTDGTILRLSRKKTVCGKVVKDKPAALDRDFATTRWLPVHVKQRFAESVTNTDSVRKN